MIEQHQTSKQHQAMMGFEEISSGKQQAI